MSSCLRSAPVAPQGSMADPPWEMRVDNTFIVVGPKRSTSLDGCFRDRQIRSWPGSMRRQRSSSGQAHSRGRYPRRASRGLSRSQARDPRVGISGPARRPPSTDRSSTRSSSLMSRSGRRVGAYIRTPSSSLSRSQARDRSRSSSLMSRSGRRVGAYIRTPPNALSGDEVAKKSSNSSKRTGSHGPVSLSHLCCTLCGEFGGRDPTACAICLSRARAEQRSNLVSGHGDVMAAGESEMSQSHTTKRMYKSESLAPLLSDQTDTFFSRWKFSWSLALLFIFSIALCSRFCMSTRNAAGDLPISGSICTGQFASVCDGADFAAKAPTVTFEAYQDTIAGINGLFARSEELRTEFGSAREILEWDALRRRFTEMLDHVKGISTHGGNVLEALQAVQIFEFHADLALFVERMEDDARLIRSSAPVPRIRFQNAMTNTVSVMANYKSLLPRLASLPPHLFDEVARRAQHFDQALLSLQSRGVEMFKAMNNVNVEASDEGRHFAAGAAVDAPPSFLQSSWQYVFDLEAHAQAQAAFIRDVEAALRRNE